MKDRQSNSSLKYFSKNEILPAAATGKLSFSVSAAPWRQHQVREGEGRPGEAELTITGQIYFAHKNKSLATT